VDDMTYPQPVDHVAESSAEDEREATTEPGLRLGSQPTEPTDNSQAYAQSQHSEQPLLPARCIGQETEGRTGVEQQRDVENRQHLNTLVQTEVLHHPCLGSLIE